MRATEQLRILEKAEQNNKELLELSLVIRKLANDRGDKEFVKQIDDDLKFLASLNEKFAKERTRLEEEQN